MTGLVHKVVFQSTDPSALSGILAAVAKELEQLEFVAG